MSSYLKFSIYAASTAGSFLLGYGLNNSIRVADSTVAVPINVPAHLEDPNKSAPPSRVSEIMKFGYPGFENLRVYEDFVLSYDRRTRTAHWVLEHLTPERMKRDPKVDRNLCQFQPDTSIHKYFQSQNSDYLRSGYDRGHLAAAGNHRKSQRAVEQTFYLTNMSPQVGKGFNRDKWNELEIHVRKHAKKNPNVFVATGPLYMPKEEADGKKYVKYKVIGNNNVAVPTHFFKVVLIETETNNFEMECYVLPNEVIPDETPLAKFLVPLESIERAAGFIIFENLDSKKVKKINGIKQGGLLW
uniref:Endonuclease n=1 Tax=Parastrongyloides trichosuri TaxID=131310 RepID=A0A0N4ZKK9_PARTI